MYLVMDLCTGGELFDRIMEKGHFYEADAAKIITTILDAVQYLHDMNIIHRDIKPENLIFRTNDVESDLMIGDFGLSRIVDNESDASKTTCGTPGYMAPGNLSITRNPPKNWAWKSCGYVGYRCRSILFVCFN